MMRALLLAALVATLGASAPPATVTLSGQFVRGASIGLADLAAMPRTQVTASEHDGSTSHYAGVTLAALLRQAGAPVGDAAKGLAARSYLTVTGSDGYVAAYSLSELDTTAASCAPILADTREGAPLPAASGPFRVVAPCDRVQARWVRNVVALTVGTLPGPPIKPMKD
ncbi:MAG TPA: molybdopterin-dependent oxidoreductase [Candidatus Sulfotelmatobacter sp.]|nr:molybdopterin-dependent oxidoreductase [Candidatus Sulfotelmatobacter sp.]